MTKEEFIAVANGKAELTVVSVTEPKLNKFARTLRDENGKKVPCPFTGIKKMSQFTFNLVAKYVPVEKAEGEETKTRASFTKPTDVSFIKESVAENGKYYLFGKVERTESFFIKDNVIISKDELAEYLPPPRPTTDGELWLTLGLDKIEVVDK